MDALHVGVVVALTLATVAVRIDVPFAAAADEVARILVECVVLGWTQVQGLTTLSEAT